MSWEIFDRAASGYEAWYATRRGRRADVAERRLLLHLLMPFQDARSAIEIGCGTGHFGAFLAQRGLLAIGLDRAPAMLNEARRQFPSLPVVLGDAHRLPFRDACADLTVFITTIEFLEDPARALSEAGRIARQGIIAIALNRHSLGGLSRRFGPQSRGALLGQARDYSAAELRTALERAALARLDRTWTASTLFPDGLSRVISHIRFGDVIGSAIRFKR
jgi:ubiquinone/menaquinone biosynthesis C-methylase UbiE